MAVKVHPSSIVEPGAELANGVEIGPFCTIGGKVKTIAGKTEYENQPKEPEPEEIDFRPLQPEDFPRNRPRPNRRPPK